MQKEIFKTSKSKPILKWAGGKQQLLSEIKERAPQNFNKYIEPFIGGGAVYFAISSDRYVISDKNPELINLYKVLPGNVDELTDLLKDYKNEEDFFYEVRAQKVEDLSDLQRAARFIYLNRTCFNGLYRVNKKGEFNVPFGKYKNPKIICEKRLWKVAARLKETTIQLADYNKVSIKYPAENDFLAFTDIKHSNFFISLN